jgi:hypothetical protein
MDGTPTQRFARCITASKRVRWDLETDVIRGRRFDLTEKFLPDGLTLAGAVPFLAPGERRYFSQVQGRTYANMFGLVERFINAKVLELSRDHWFGDQTALEALIRFSDEELKHQALFRRVEMLIGEAMPAGYSFSWEPNDVAGTVLSKSSWAVLALTLHIELFTQAHYRESIREEAELSELARDVFRFHWKEECQHAVMDELEWRRVDASTTAEARDLAVDELIELVGAVDAIVTVQAAADSRYFVATCGRQFDAATAAVVEQTMLAAYRLQFILSGARHPHFVATLASMTTEPQLARIGAALSALAPPAMLNAA